MSDATAPAEPKVMAFLQYADEEFLCGMGSTKEEAYAAMLEGQEVHERLLAMPVSYLRITQRSTGWSTETRENLG